MLPDFSKILIFLLKAVQKLGQSVIFPYLRGIKSTPMYIQQLYTNCLAEAAYYIESDGFAAIIDPMRETAPYVALAKERNATIKYIFETHFHADFVSGHLDLAKQTGAPIIYGPTAKTGFDSYIAKDGEVFELGKLKIKVLHTPGHTQESSCFLLFDEAGKEHCIFTGDTLFVGDVGRPDLLDASVKLTPQDMASMLYDSLNTHIKPLADDVLVYPAHGPGSACGKNIGKETWSTIGQQKSSNYALKAASREDFIKALTTDIPKPPAYFFADARINKMGYDNVESVVERNNRGLSISELEQEVAQGALVLDTRNADDFEKGFIKRSINIGLEGQFAVWVGTLLDINRPVVLVTKPGTEAEAILRMARVGFEKVSGYLVGGFEAWAAAGKAIDRVASITPEEFATMSKDGQHAILDVRKPGEIQSGFVKGAQLVSLQELASQLSMLDQSKECLVHCAGGYRSMVAVSILKANGIHNVKNVYGGFGKIKNTDATIVVPVASMA